VANPLGPEHPDDTVAFVTVRLHANGMLSTQGHIGDKVFAIKLLENGIDAIRSQMKDRSEIVVPSRDVAVPELVFPTRERGDIPEDERGDS